MKTLLLIEDSKEAQVLVKRVLEAEYTLYMVDSILEANRALDTRSYDLILLDVTLPDGDGFKFCKELSDRGITHLTPVVMLTAKSEVTDRVQGLSGGADDYVAKPFDARELKARIEAVLRRRAQNRTPNEMTVGDVLVNLVDQKAFKVEDTSRAIDLTPIEFKIFVHIARAAGQVVTREELYQSVWGKGVHISSRNIDTHVCKLRQKLESQLLEIKSSRGKGYQLIIKNSEPKKAKPAVQDTVLPIGASL